MERMTAKQLVAAATKELVAYYNHFAGKNITKFSSRVAGLKQCAPYAIAEISSRGAAIAASWADPEVRADRCTRTRVAVDGVEYRSVAAAFAALGLSMGAHIRVRMHLKATGELVYANHHFVALKE